MFKEMPCFDSFSQKKNIELTIMVPGKKKPHRKVLIE